MTAAPSNGTPAEKSEVRNTLSKGKLKNRNFISYKIPTRLDMGRVRVDFESSYEKTGPFGAKSIGEVVINTPSPAIADAVYNGTGLRFRTLPITSEQVFMGLNKK